MEIQSGKTGNDTGCATPNGWRSAVSPLMRISPDDSTREPFKTLPSSSFPGEGRRSVISGSEGLSSEGAERPRALPLAGARGFVMSFAAFVLVGFALIVGIGLAVDGYGVFGTRILPASIFPPNLRLLKHGDRVTKAIEIAERHGDELLIIGDSRSQHGLDPDAPALGGVRGYNAALAAATLAEQVVVLDYTLRHEPTIKHVVWGLSFESFPFGIFETSDYADSAFAGKSLVSGLLRHLFALDRVISSWKALLEARHGVRAPMKRNGVVTYASDPVEGQAIVGLFERELAGKVRELSGPISQAAIDQALGRFAQRLRELKASGIDVDLVIVPVHAWRLEFFRRIGVESQSDAWKRQLAATVDSLASAPGTGRIRFFDFARPHHFVEQSVYRPPPRGERRYYLESSHFYPWLGDKVLARVFGKVPETEKAQETFGREIGRGGDAISIDDDIASANAGQDRWEASHPDDVAHVTALTSQP
jgi:hypothetical protein